MEHTASYSAYVASPYLSIKHSTYFEAYDALFTRYRDRPITFVEIGVLGGGSLFMWREFFGPKARIIGVDLNPNARKWQEHGFEIFIGSQSDPAFWESFRAEVGPVDILLDDGGHTYSQQIVTTEAMLTTIRDNGLLVVEDTHTSYMDGFGPQKFSFVEYSKRMVDRVNHRSCRVEGRPEETRIWSIQFFESIVAFHINRVASTRPCQQTVNGRESDGAEDFRNHDRSALRISRFLQPLKPLVRSLPGALVLNRWLSDRRDVRRSGIDRFFT